VTKWMAPLSIQLRSRRPEEKPPVVEDHLN
jgi:hypothetical protein